MPQSRPSSWALLRHYRDYGAEMGPAWLDLRARLARHGVDLASRRILEIGTGEFYPYGLLFASTGHQVAATDIGDLAWAGLTWSRFQRLREESGGVRAVARWAFDLCKQAAYYGALGRSAGVRLQRRAPWLLRQDAARIAFGRSTFDLCVSSAAFEHILDVPAAVAEIARVLRPGALADIEIHLFPSLSGGHEFELSNHRPPPAGFRLWGHLDNPGWQAPVPLNRWREKQYQSAFAVHFDVLERLVRYTHGEAYLTDEIRNRLPDYSREELVTESVVYVLRRKDGAVAS